MRRIWLSIHQHKPRAMYLGLTLMLNRCRLSGSLNLLSVSSPGVAGEYGWNQLPGTGIYGVSSLNSLFRTSRWLVMAVLARKTAPYENSADWVSMRLTHSRPLWPAPPRQASMICAWGPVTHGSFKKQRGEIFGWSWWGSGDVGGRQRWWGLGKSGAKQCKALQMWRICSAAVMTGECVRGGDECPSWTLTDTQIHPPPPPPPPP